MRTAVVDLTIERVGRPITTTLQCSFVGMYTSKQLLQDSNFKSPEILTNCNVYSKLV